MQTCIPQKSRYTSLKTYGKRDQIVNAKRVIDVAEIHSPLHFTSVVFIGNPISFYTRELPAVALVDISNG